MSKPKVVFVLGGPGAGKGTECAKLVDEFDFVHLSAGDLLREERKNGGEKGELINNYIKEGKIIPVAITIGLIDTAMKKAGAGGKNKFLIDGFPRNADNLSGWNEMMKDVCDVRFCLYMQCSEETMEKRLLGRNEGRADDNIEAIKKRFATYHESTMPIIKTFEKEGLLRQVDSSKTPEEVHNVCKDIFAEFKLNKPNVVFVLGGPGAGKGTECAKLVDEFGFVHLSAGDLLREERKNGGEKGELIDSYIKEGKIIPVAITIGLIDVAMKKAGANGKDKFLIDGFPRNADNLSGWNEMMKDVCDVRFCLYMECSEETMEKRLLGRNEGRADDNIEAIKKRFATYHESTMPIIKTFEKEGLLRLVDSSRTPEQVHATCQEIFAEFSPKPYCVVVDALIKEERMEEFLKIIKADAVGARETEEGCIRFDVLQDPKNKCKFIFYEIYKDEAAFQVHMKAPHFLPWLTFCGEAGSETSGVASFSATINDGLFLQ